MSNKIEFQYLQTLYNQGKVNIKQSEKTSNGDSFLEEMKAFAEKNNIIDEHTGKTGMLCMVYEGEIYRYHNFADGTAELSEADIAELANKYDFENMTNKDKAKLICDLSLLNVIDGSLAGSLVHQLILPEHQVPFGTDEKDIDYDLGKKKTYVILPLDMICVLPKTEMLW